MEKIKFLKEKGVFTLNHPENVSYLNLPIASETGLKSDVTPNFGGDAKIDQETFLLEPVSSENLHNNRSARNFWCVLEDGSVFSAMGNSAEQEAAKFTSAQDESKLTAGFMWQSVERTSAKLPLNATVTAFVPVEHNVEILKVEIRNTSDQTISMTPYAAIPIYGRSADNIRDHRNVTSMLHRIKTTRDSVVVKPTLSFDEKGHRVNHNIYYVTGRTGDGQCPEAFYPTVDDFIGEGGTYTKPRSVYEGKAGFPEGTAAEGKEAMGAMRFAKTAVAAGETVTYVVLLGVEQSEEAIASVQALYQTAAQADQELEHTKNYWNNKVNIDFHTGDGDFDALMQWVSFQPFLRRVFGCSFLPYHDYGRGGRGWRDLWQDCLSLLLMDPDDVGRMIEMNFSGVRADGTNATIIGAGDGNFIADRNGIARVWMDHALWPQMTTELYMDQTGDVDILGRKAAYFKDPQAVRGTDTDTDWTEAYGSKLRTAGGEIYEGTILEHLLIQQLAAFFEVGDHNIYRLRGADWNDALDMAAERGESVAFTAAYAGNLKSLANIIRTYAKVSGAGTVEIMKEAAVLLEGKAEDFDSIEAKQALLKQYGELCRHTVSGEKVAVDAETVAKNLEEKARWLMDHLRKQEWIEGKDQEGWFNSYYDNHGRVVEGFFGDQVRMMLIGQVFSIMSGTATEEQICKIVKAADHYLYRKEIGGYRLNTDFKELKFDMGRMFGFAYGEKENGAVFSHMTVMFANALYKRGFARQGWKALRSLADTALDFDTGRMYPGIPEYFRADGRGMYPYLTGAASWYLMTMVTEIFGVRGNRGDLILEPKLLSEQFDEKREAAIVLPFAGKQIAVTYRNPEAKEFGAYRIGGVKPDQSVAAEVTETAVRISRAELSKLAESKLNITVELQ